MDLVRVLINRYRVRMAGAREQLEGAVSLAPDHVVATWVAEGRRLSAPADVFGVGGCTTEEVRTLRKAWEGWMPAASEAFLLLLGQMPRGIDVGVNCYWPPVLEAEEALSEWEDEMRALAPDWFDTRYERPADAIPIGHHEGYIFGFFVERSDDPPILMMRELADEPFSTDGVPFSECVIKAIDRRLDLELRRLESVRSR